MVAAVELEDCVAASEGARQPYRAHRGLGSARDKAHHLEVRHSPPNQLAELNLELRWHSEAGSVLHRALESIENDRRRVSEYERSPRQDKIYVLVTIDIPDPRSFAARNDYRLSSNCAKCAHGRAHPTGEKIARASHHFG